MCGIFGIAGRRDLAGKELEGLRRARDTLVHRGPDHQGEWYDEKVYVGHTRLGILDLSSAGNQPMVSQDGRVVLAANCEIYNFKVLRASLRDRYPFVSEGDTEVILHGYREWGIEELVRRIEGMFAFSLYDVEQRVLYLVRDRVGIKPLYYADLEDGFGWASELKALRAHYGVKLEADITALYDYLTYLYVPTPKTLFRDVFKLPPGHILELRFDSGQYDIRSYWALSRERIDDARPLAEERLSALLEASVESQQVADVPLGFFLSGGVDSSAVVAAAASRHDDVRTFSIGFDVPGFSELDYAQQVADHLGTRHDAAILRQEDAVNLVEELPKLYDEPFADTSALPTYLVARHAAKEVKVVLTGDGGDEVFSGYRWYGQDARRKLSATAESRLLGKLKTRLPVLRRAARGLERYFLLRGYPYYVRLLGGMIANEKALYRGYWEIPDDYDDYWYFRQHYDPSLPTLTALQVLDFQTYLPDDILTKVDRATMAHSLETRVPLLDTDLVVYSLGLSQQVRGANKSLLKSVVTSRLPLAITQRKKKGFGVPAYAWRASIFDRNRTRQENLLRYFCPELLPR